MELIFTAFIIKHFVCDFPLQVPYMLLNKGKYGHPGGILHASVQGVGTLAVCVGFGLPLWLALADAVIHYHVDWAKNQLDAPKDGSMIIAVHTDYSGVVMIFWGERIEDGAPGWVTADNIYDGDDAEYAGWIQCPEERTSRDPGGRT